MFTTKQRIVKIRTLQMVRLKQKQLWNRFQSIFWEHIRKKIEIRSKSIRS